MEEERPSSISIDLIYDRDGLLDANSLIMTLESQLGGRIRITDWYDESKAAEDYPHLSAEERRAVVDAIDTGDYDLAIDDDLRRDMIDQAVESAGFELASPSDDEDEDEAETAMTP